MNAEHARKFVIMRRKHGAALDVLEDVIKSSIRDAHPGVESGTSADSACQ